MHLEQLELYATVVEQGGMTAAADKLGMSQPAVSRSIRTLERQLGVSLFRRDGRSVEPTAAGRLAYERVTTLTTDWRSLMAELRLLAGRPDDVVLAVPFGTARILIPVLVRRAATDLPDIRVRVIESASPDSRASVASGDIDAAVIYPEPEMQPADPGLEVLCTERLCAMGQQELVGHDNVAISLHDLAQLPLLLTGPTWSIRRSIDAAFASIGAEPQVLREVGIADALLSFALEGDGVAILPYSNAARDHELELLAVREIEQPEIERSLTMCLGTGLPEVVADELRSIITASVAEVASSARWTIR